MKFACLAIAVVSLTACATNSTIVADTSTRERPEAIRAFEEVCLKTAPGLSTAGDAAARLGIAKLTDAGFMKMGFNKNQSVGVQIKENNECVMTTPSQRNGSLTRRFLQAAGQFSRTAPSTTVSAKATIGGEAFIFLHDQKGGEAFVMLETNIDLSLMDDTLAVIARPTHCLVIARPQAVAIHRRSSAAMDCRAALAMTRRLSRIMESSIDSAPLIAS